MSNKSNAALNVPPLPQSSTLAESLVEIAVTYNIPVMAINDRDSLPPAILFVNAELLPDCLDAIRPTLSRLTQSS